MQSMLVFYPITPLDFFSLTLSETIGYFTNFCSFFVELSLSQIIGEYGPSRDPKLLDLKCKNLQVIIEKVHR